MLVRLVALIHGDGRAMADASISLYHASHQYAFVQPHSVAASVLTRSALLPILTWQLKSPIRADFLRMLLLSLSSESSHPRLIIAWLVSESRLALAP